METKTEIAQRILIEGCRNQNRQSQQKIYELYADAMYSTSVRILGNSMDAQDIIQESFIDAFNKIDSFKENSTFGAWLKRIVINKSLNELKKKKLVFEEVDTQSNVFETDNYTEPEYSIEMVQKAVAELSDGYRTIFNLFAFEGYSHKEIANELGITESTSKSQFNRAKKRIRESVTKILQHG